MVDVTGEVSVVAFDGLAEKFHETIQLGCCNRVSLYATKRLEYAQGTSGCEVHLTKVIESFRVVLFSLIAFLGAFLGSPFLQVSRVKECDCANVPNTELPKTELVDVLTKHPPDTVTIGVIVHEVLQSQDVTCRDGRSRKRQLVTVIDESSRIGQITLWESFTGMKDGREGSFVELQILELKDFRGKRTLSSRPLSSIRVEHADDDPFRAKLLGWYASPRSEVEFQELLLPGASASGK